MQRLGKPELRDHAHMSLVGYQTLVINFGHIHVSEPVVPYVSAPCGS